jgi:hypothetical protein
VAAAVRRPERLRGRVAVAAGGAVTYLVDGRVTDRPPERIDAAIEAPLSVLTAVLADGRWLGPWLAGRLRTRGNPLRVLELLRAFRD